MGESEKNLDNSHELGAGIESPSALKPRDKEELHNLLRALKTFQLPYLF